MKSLPKSANLLIQQFSKLPGIGKKTAQRLTFHILQTETNEVASLSKALLDVKEKFITVQYVMALLKTIYVQFAWILIEIKISFVLLKILMI